MRELEVTLVVGCPNKCSYCPQDVLLEAYESVRVMPFGFYKECLDKVDSSVKVHFSAFGEPCCHPDIVRITNYTLDKGHELMFFTTLVGVSMADLKQLEGLKYDAFVVHLINEVEQVSPLDDAYFERLAFVANGDFSNLVFITTGKNSKRSLDVVKDCRCQGLVRISRGGLMPWVNKIVPYKGGIWCRRTDQNVLMPNGDVIICSVDFGLRYKIGNLLSQSVEEIDGSVEKRQFLLDMEFGKVGMCNNCEYARRAFFGCRRFYPVKSLISHSIVFLKGVLK